MVSNTPSMAQQVAQAVATFQERITGRTPRSVLAAISENTVLVLLHETLTPAEMALAKTPRGAQFIQELHRQLFATGGDSLRQAIARITGTQVRSAASEIETAASPFVRILDTGTTVQLFRLSQNVHADVWSGDETSPHLENNNPQPG